MKEENTWKRVCSCFTDGLEASEEHAEVGKHGEVLMTGKLPELRCFGFSEVFYESPSRLPPYNRTEVSSVQLVQHKRFVEETTSP